MKKMYLTVNLKKMLFEYFTNISAQRVSITKMPNTFITTTDHWPAPKSVIKRYKLWTTPIPFKDGSSQ